jgi:tetratricopeptide (TPR) repeat protein
MHEVLEWSYRTLSAPAQAALRKLSVLRGPFDARDAARLVDDADSINDVLAELVDKSLLVLECQSSLPLRMLMVIRRFALDALASAGELESVTECHLAWSLERSAELAEAFLGAEPERSDAEISALFDDFAAAFEHALDAERHGEAARLAVSLAEYLVLEGRFEIAHRWFVTLKSLELAAADRVRVLMFAGVTSYFRGIHNLDADAALGDLRQALALAEELGDDELIGEVCVELGAVHWSAGSDAAEAYYRRALACGSTYTRVRTLNGLGGIRSVDEHHADALAHFRASVDLAHEAQLLTREIIGQFNAAHCLLQLGRHDEARELLTTSLEPARRTVRALVPGICESLAECARATGDRAAAVSWLQEGIAIARAMGNTPTASAMLEALAELSGARETSAHRAVDQADATGISTHRVPE